jgi:small subunit ribosomal protein S6
MPNTNHVREYETIYILRSDVDVESAEKLQNRVAEVVTREAGKLVKVESWGRRKLAYPVNKQTKGVYMYLKYVGKGGLVAELERNLKLSDAVVKLQTIVLRDDVDMGALQINAEEATLGKLELEADNEEVESREKQLGLVDSPEARRAKVEDDFGDDFDDDDDDLPPPGTGKDAAKDPTAN